MPNRSGDEKCKSGDGEFSLYDTVPADLPVVLLDASKFDSIYSRIQIASGAHQNICGFFGGGGTSGQKHFPKVSVIRSKYLIKLNGHSYVV